MTTAANPVTACLALGSNLGDRAARYIVRRTARPIRYPSAAPLLLKQRSAPQRGATTTGEQ